MNPPFKFSFYSLLTLIFLIPLFFVPSTLMPLGVAKSVLLSVGLIVTVVALLVEALKQGGVRVPSATLLWSVLVIPLIYLLSALTSVTPNQSLFGYNFEIGTFGFTLLTFILLLVTTIVVNSVERLKKVYQAIFLSFFILIAYVTIKILTDGSFLSFGVLSGPVGNPVGAWTDIAVLFGLATTLFLLATARSGESKRRRTILYGGLVLGLFLLMVINFSTAWQLTLGGSLFILIYLMTIERQSLEAEGGLWKRSKLLPTVIVLLVSLLFAINPTLGSDTLGNHVSNAFHVTNSDVRPSFSSTWSVTQGVLGKHALLGSGPNTFDQDWLLYKPATINATTFWNVAFPFGVGFIPTALATTGIVGIIGWVLFLAFLLLLAIATLGRRLDSTLRFPVIGSLVAALFLWIAAIVYVPSATIFGLAAIFTGLFVAACSISGIIAVREVNFHLNPAVNFGAFLFLAIIGLGALAFGFFTWQKTLSIVHFEKALALSQTQNASADQVESELNRAIELSPVDIYYGALSELSFARAQSIVQNATGTPEANQALFQTAIQKSITAAHQAASANPNNYQNWVRLGNIFESLVPAPLSVQGAYENAKVAYDQAAALSPESPEPALLEARLEIDHGNVSGARSDIATALQKKQDYADAYFLLTELDIAQNNIGEGIQSAQTAALLSPDNAGIFFELGLLKYASGDYAGAADALTHATQIVPQYANAEYFLGLAEEKLGKHDTALAAFQDLAKTNPDNPEVSLILTNLEANRDPFYQAPVKAQKPLKSATPPIANQE